MSEENISRKSDSKVQYGKCSRFRTFSKPIIHLNYYKFLRHEVDASIIIHFINLYVEIMQYLLSHCFIYSKKFLSELAISKLKNSLKFCYN